MILVADSGSTKCDWITIDQGVIGEKSSTVGFNPYFCDESFILNGLSSNSSLVAIKGKVKEIHFYGAGCSSPERNDIVRHALQKFFPEADVEVEHDVLASAIATCGNHPGLACILGTGSNSCYYDGKIVHDSNFGLGYIMGDEGSGSYFGKKLITHYLYGILPEPTLSAFQSRYLMNKEIMIEHVYASPGANVWLASFAKFFTEHPNDVWVRKMVQKGFEEFFDLAVINYPDYRKLEVHFVGSIAFYFEDILRAVGASREAKVGRIVRQPILGLAEFFKAKSIAS
jgi:N-acetylglucosamine kinase-like BadF-type ATPase